MRGNGKYTDRDLIELYVTGDIPKSFNEAQMIKVLFWNLTPTSNAFRNSQTLAVNSLKHSKNWLFN